MQNLLLRRILPSYLNRKYKFTGTISSIGDQTFVLWLSETQSLTFEYHGDTNFAVGASVTVYGELKTVTDNVPACYAWFVM